MALTDFRPDAMRCTRCSYCKFIPYDLVRRARFAEGCPSIRAGKFHAYSAGGRLFTALSGLGISVATVVTRAGVSTDFAYLPHLQSTFPTAPWPTATDTS